MTVPVPGHLGRILDDDGAPAGTCFQAAPGVLVTAAHVLDGLGKAAAGAAVGVDLLAGGDVFGAHVVAVDDRRDLAVLRSLREFPASVAGFAATGTVPAGAGVTVVAAGEVDDQDHTYRFMTATGAWQGTTVRDDTVVLGRFRSADVLRGMSGAPVWQEDGLVVGVLSGRYNSTDGWLAHSVWAVGTEYLADLLNGVTTVAPLDVSTQATRWRARRAEYLDAMTRLAREQRDSFLVGNCGPPLIPAFVRRHGSNDRRPTPASELLAMTGDCRLLGGPGAGKSRLLRAWTLELAAGARVPVLLRAGDLAAAAGSPIGPVRPLDALAAAVDAGLGAVGHDGLPWLAEWFTGRPVGEVEWVVLVDGLDEVTDDRLRNRVFAVLAAVSEEPAWRCRVVVASRPLTEDDGAGGGWLPDRYDLLAFDHVQRDAFVGGWFAELGLADPARAARDFVTDLNRRGLHHLARIPLMLMILAQLFAYDDSARTLPASRVDAYARIVEETHRRRPRGSAVTSEIHDWHDENLAAAVESLHERLGGLDGLLSRLAFERFAGRADSAVDWVCAQTRDLRGTTRLTEDHWRVVVREALRHNRLLVAHGRDFEFVHATLHEFFSARHLASDRKLSKELLRLVFGRRGERFDGVPRWQHRNLTAAVEYGREFPFLDWVYAFWSDWSPFAGTLLRLVRRDGPEGCVLVAFLSWRWVRLDDRVVAAAATKLRTMLPDAPVDDTVSVADLLAMLRDPAGYAALVAAAADPGLGTGRVTAAGKLIAHGDPRGPDLLAEATDAVVNAPEPSRFTDKEAMARRLAAQDLVRRGDPRAVEILRRFLLDPRTDDGRTRRYVYGMLDYAPDGPLADVVAALLTTVPATPNGDDQYQRNECVKVLLKMTDPGCADRLARMAATTATLPDLDRAKAAVRLADLGDPRAAELLAGLIDIGDDNARHDVAWALARVGDPRAVAPLAATSERILIFGWQRQVRTAATNGNPATVEVLAELAESAALARPLRYEVLFWLTMIDDPRGIEGSVRAAADSGRGLLTLADGLARRRDPRFTTLLTRWVDALTPDDDERRRWAARVLAAPERVLGDGLLADGTMARELDPHTRYFFVLELFDTDHPRAMDCLVALHRDFEVLDPYDLRSDVVDLLARKGSLVALPRLAERVRDTDRYERDRSEALELLTTLDGPGVADTLVALAPEVLTGDRWTLSHKLLTMGDPRAGAVLATWLIEETKDYPFDGWDWKLGRLQEHHDPQLVTVLEHVMEEFLCGRGQIGVRGAVEDLADVGGPRAVELLARWAADPRLTEEDRRLVTSALVVVDPDRAEEQPEPLSQQADLFRYYAREP